MCEIVPSGTRENVQLAKTMFVDVVIVWRAACTPCWGKLLVE